MTRRDRIVIFAVAVVVRCVVGWIFFGSVDVTNAMLYSPRLFDGWPASGIRVPYLPGIYQFLVWISGALAVATALPLTFCYKLFPILFDGALAVLVHDALLPDRRRARNAGLLYALAPVSIIITALHTQWDAIAFAFLMLSFLLVAKKTEKAAALAGAAFVLSVLVKPVAIPFLPLLFAAPWRMLNAENRRRTIAIIGGMAAVTITYLLVMLARSNPLLWHHVEYVLNYAGGGAQLLGLPRLIGRGESRLFNLVPILLLIPLYWKRLIRREEAVLLMLCAVFGTSGLSPQYLLWLVPFLLVCGRERFAAWYSLVAGLFLVIYYAHPGLTGFNVENLGAYAPLKPLAWLAPVPRFMAAKTFLFGFLGNFVLPVSLCIYFLLEVIKSGRRVPLEDEPEPALSERRLLTPVLVATALTLIAAVAMAFEDRTSAQFEKMLERKIPQYEMHRYHGEGLVNPQEPTWVIPIFARIPKPSLPVDALTFGYAWVLLWTVAAWRLAPRTAEAVAVRRNVPVVAAVAIVAIGIVATMTAHAARAQQHRVPHVDEAEYLHAGYLLHDGQRVYRDFFEHHSPLLFQLLAPLVPGVATFTVDDVGDYIGRARTVMSLLGLLCLGVAGWLAWRISRWPGAPLVVMAPLLVAPATWLRGLTDVRNDVPSLMLFWGGAALLLHQWPTARRQAICSGIGIGLAFASALWNPKWPLVSLFLGGVYLFRVWRSWKSRTLAWALAPAAALVAITLGAIRSASTFTDYINFTFRYSMSLGDWFAGLNQPFFDNPLKFCPPAFKGLWPILAAVVIIALLLRGRLDAVQRWQLGAVAALAALAALEVRFVAPYPNLWAQFFMMWCFTMAVVYATAAGMLIELVPRPARDGVGIAVIVAVAAVVMVFVAPRMRAQPLTAETYYPTMTHMLAELRPADTVWLGVGNHPIAARDAHYYWFGFNEHVAHILETQQRGQAPAFLPKLQELDLPPCRAARGLDRNVRFVSTGHDLVRLPLTQRCADFLVRSGRALVPGEPFGGFVKLER